MRTYLTLFCLLFLTQSVRAGRETDFPDALLSVLHDGLNRSAPFYTDDLFARISERTGLSGAEIRLRISALLDALDTHRKKKSAQWKELIRQGESDIPPEAADKLLRHLIKESRSMLEGKGNYLLDSGIQRACRKTRLPLFLGRTFLLRALEWSLADTSGRESGEGVGIVVSGHTNHFEINLDPLFLFFDSRDESYVREQVREIQRFVIPLLVQKLPESEAIRWAVRQREANALVEPRYRLDLEIDGLSFSGSNLDLRPCMEATVELRDEKNGEVVLKRPFKFCTTQNGSKVTHVLTPFYGEVADRICGMIDEFLTR